MLVHYCGAPGACNNNEAKNLPSPLSSHPLYPKLHGLAAVLRGCCSFFSFSRSPVSCIFLFTLPFASSAKARSAQALSKLSPLHPSVGQGEETTRHQNVLISIFFFFFFHFLTA